MQEHQNKASEEEAKNKDKSNSKFLFKSAEHVPDERRVCPWTKSGQSAKDLGLVHSNVLVGGETGRKVRSHQGKTPR